MQKGDTITAIDTGEKWIVDWAGITPNSQTYFVRAWRRGKRSLFWPRLKDYRLFYEGEYTY